MNLPPRYSLNRRSRVILAIAITIVLCLGPAVFFGAWQAALFALTYFALLTAVYWMAGYLDRRVFPQGLSFRAKSGWLVLGAILGALIGPFFAPSQSDMRRSSLDSAICLLEGAIIGTGIGMVIDLAKSFPRVPVRFQFRIWHALAFFYIFAWCLFIVMTLVELFKVRSML